MKKLIKNILNESDLEWMGDAISDMSRVNDNIQPLVTQEEAWYYMSEADLIRFVVDNSDYDWDEAISMLCDDREDYRNCVFGDEGRTGYTREYVMGSQGKWSIEKYGDERVLWLRLFFEAHPFINNVMFVFDD